jgi:hypothetical protein
MQHSQPTKHIHAPGGIRTHDLSRREAADLRFRSRGHWDWQYKWFKGPYSFETVSQELNIILEDMKFVLVQKQIIRIKQQRTKIHNLFLSTYKK